MIDNRNTLRAVILSGLVLIGWQYFFNIPQMEKQRAAQQAQSEMVKPAPQAGSTTTPPTGQCPGDKSARRRGTPQPRYRHCLGTARQDRDPTRDRQHFAEGRPHRRSGPGAVPRERRSKIAGDRAILALGNG